MVGKRLNKIIDQCQLNWQIIDCVEELSTNFLTNTVQEENLNTLIEDINKEYIPEFSKKNNEKVNEITQRAKARLIEIKKLNLDEMDTQLKNLKGTDVLTVILQQFKDLFNNYENEIMEDELEFENLGLQIEEDEFTNIIKERKEIISRLRVILENTKESSATGGATSSAT